MVNRKHLSHSLWYQSVQLMLLISCLGMTSGCGQSGPTETVIEAKRLLQIGKQQEALDLLKSDKTAESYYLKTLALERLGSREIAKEEIKTAIEIDPENLKYQGLELRLALFEGDIDAANKLETLYQNNPPSADLALYAAYAYKGRSIKMAAAKNLKEASDLHQKAMDALNTAASLSAEIPELQSEVLVFATKFRQADSAQLVIDKIEEKSSGDVDLLKEKIDVALLKNRIDEALKLAKIQYKKNEQNETTAMSYANILAKVGSSKENTETFESIRSKYPRNVVILTRYAMYLTRNNELQEALNLLNNSLKFITNKQERGKVVYVAVDLPLEVGNIKATEEQLNLHRKNISDPLIIFYFQGRIAYLKKDYKRAVQNMLYIIEQQKSDVQSSRALAGEAMKWTQIIMADKTAADQLEKTTETVRKQLKLNVQEIKSDVDEENSALFKPDPENSESVDPPEDSKETKKKVAPKSAD